jgi:ABC-type sugar transport system permease subunit
VQKQEGEARVCANKRALLRALLAGCAASLIFGVASNDQRRGPSVFKKRVASRREAYFFASPALFLIVSFVIFPLCYSFYLTFQNYDLAIGPPAEYVRLDSYREMLLDDVRFWRSWVNTFIRFRGATSTGAG